MRTSGASVGARVGGVFGIVDPVYPSVVVGSVVVDSVVVSSTVVCCSVVVVETRFEGGVFSSSVVPGSSVKPVESLVGGWKVKNYWCLQFF